MNKNSMNWGQYNTRRVIKHVTLKFSTTWLFQFFENESIIIKFSNLFIKILFWEIIF